MNRSCLVPLLFFVLAVGSCKSKVKDATGETDFFPVQSYLQSQVRQVDTSLFSITKITQSANRNDTVYLKREEFRQAAHDFLSLPDLTTSKEKFTETKLYDEDLKKVVISYAPTDKTSDNEITRQEVLIEPSTQGADQVQTIYTETLLHAGDSTVQKRLTWNVAQSFQVIKLVTKKGSPETVETTNVVWGAPL